MQIFWQSIMDHQNEEYMGYSEKSPTPIWWGFSDSKYHSDPLSWRLFLYTQLAASWRVQVVDGEPVVVLEVLVLQLAADQVDVLAFATATTSSPATWVAVVVGRVTLNVRCANYRHVSLKKFSYQ